MWFFGSTEAERKRDQYFRLHRKLEHALSKQNTYVKDIQTAMNDYQSTIPRLSSDKIPSDDFEPKREDLTKELQGYFDYEKDKTADLSKAKQTAHDKYLHYKKIAEEEARARHEQMMNELKSLFGGDSSGR